MKYKVLITTSGLGNRLGDITKYTNKSLVRVGDKPAISYIVESYPEDVEFVITLGHFGSHVKQFLCMAYPNRTFTYVEVDKYQGPDSSLAYSILQAKQEMDCPFIFHACDTIVTNEIKAPIFNWIAGNKNKDSSSYVSLITNRNSNNNEYVMEMKDKGEINYDYSYIGLAGIFDYELFFEKLQNSYDQQKLNSQLSDVIALKEMIQSGAEFKFENCSSWFDIGNVHGLKKARLAFHERFDVLDKLEESIFVFDDNFVIKFFYDTQLCKNRVERAKHLNGLVPNILDSSDNFFKYEFVPGELFASMASEKNITHFMEWSVKNLWKPKSNSDFSSKCFDFYFSKTLKRLEKFIQETGIHDVECTINSIKVPSIREMLANVNEEWLCNGNPVQFHGDFILDNIISQNDEYKLLDWRQDFAGELESGDQYYDLAKFNHNLIFNHDIVNKGLFTLEFNHTNIKCDILRSHNLVECQKAFRKFLVENDFDVMKVDVLTAIIWINMAPLHQHPLNNFLFYFGKFHLFKALHEIS